jgi:mycothiol synthase
MELVMRPYAGDGDLPVIADLIRAAPPASRHLVDYPWRLSSPALQSPDDARLWLAHDGTLVGFAAWQVWWAVLDFYVRPGPLRTVVEEAIFAWAPTRFRELDADRGRALPYWVEAREDDGERLALLERHGYVLDDDYAYVMMSRPLDVAPPPQALPAGFAIRPLAGEGEVDAYVALHRRAFVSMSMTAEWRARTLRTPTYRPALDLVAVAADGRLAGFCVGWLAPERRAGQIEPLGVDPAFQGRGLGRALLLEMFSRFAALGAEQALVETETTRSPARRVYEAVGFRPTHQALRKGQWLSPHRP